MQIKNGWLKFVKDRAVILAIVVIGIFSGALYAVYAIGQGSLTGEMVKDHFNYQIKQLEIGNVLLNFWTYEKKILLIGLTGMIAFLDKMGLILIAGYILAYGFSVTVMFAMVDVKNNLVMIVSVLLQAILMITMFTELGNWILKKSVQDTGEGSLILIQGSLVAAIATLLENISHLC